MFNLTSKLGKINNIEQKSSYFRLFYAKHKCLSIILICVVVVVSKKIILKIKDIFFFCFSFSLFGKRNMVLGKKVAIFNWEWDQI